MPFLEAWYDRLDVSTLLDNINQAHGAKQFKRAEKTMNKAEGKTNLGALHRYAEKTDDGFQIMNDPPVIVRMPFDQMHIATALLDGAWERYLETMAPDRRVVIERYRRIDFARKVVGVGSVGTQAFMMLLMGDRDDDPLFLQFKEAQQSVLAPYAGPSIYKQEGERVVQGQRIMQAASDPFLGWAVGPGKAKKHFYLRQLRDMKGSARVERMGGVQIAAYGALCGAVLARAHSRSGDAAMITGYLGTGSVFAESMATFGDTYADQNELDFEALKQAEASGRIVVESGV
uniref:Unannotated protein n=1 Tax=freshwater metagenome TaxID=449393 RepID=A0A6J5ZMK0_9ZZZZ